MKEPFDFSSCIHFEASGDSEDYCDHDPILHDDDDNNDDDDAMSCSYERSGICDPDEVNWYESRDADDGNDDNDDDDDEKKDDVCYGTSCCEDDDDEMQEKHQKSYVSFDSGGQDQFVDEMEKNRLFWEACLAS